MRREKLAVLIIGWSFVILSILFILCFFFQGCVNPSAPNSTVDTVYVHDTVRIVDSTYIPPWDITPKPIAGVYIGPLCTLRVWHGADSASLSYDTIRAQGTAVLIRDWPHSMYDRYTIGGVGFLIFLSPEDGQYHIEIPYTGNWTALKQVL